MPDVSPKARRPPARRDRSNTYTRLFEAIREGAFVGVLDLSHAPRSASTAANPHLKSILGYPAGTPSEQVNPFAPDRFVDPAARSAFLERLQSEGAVNDYILRMRRVDGTPACVEVTAHAEPAGADALRVVALFRDVSERRKLDDQSRGLYQQLLQAEKMAALGQTISGVAHELNNPLATILSWAERLAEKPLDSTTKRGVDVILGEADRAARIVRNVLTLARKRHSTRTMVDLNQVVTDTLSLRTYEHQLANIQVVTALASGLPQVFADAHQMQQVLLNLIVNAEQAMTSVHGRGSLVVRTWHDVEANTIALEVTDDGPGVPVEMRNKIFDPFFTTKDVGEGTGLGLSVAYAIVQEHGGQIRVDSHPARGASFVVELPVRSLETDGRPLRPPPPSMEGVRGASVLLVEDEHALATAVEDGLVDAGLQVDYAGDGEEALARVREKTYDAIICDLKMPRLDGMSFYRAIASATPALSRRIIFVTGDVADADAGRFLEESGCRWLAKPFRLTDLLRAVRETLG